MDSSNFWWQAAAADDGGGGNGAPDQGDAIGQSLRFKGVIGYHLRRESFPVTQTNVSYTFSGWVKNPSDNIADDQHIIGNYKSDGTHTYLIKGTTGNAARANTFSVQYLGNFIHGEGRARDVAAWYHVVFGWDSTTQHTSLWVNGRLDWSKPVATDGFNDQNGKSIGITDISPAYGNYFWRGYMTEFHFIDGRLTGPAPFGRVNASGLWVPVNPQKDGDTAWYGPNGFHLTFADANDLGKDYSGNGNDFVATGFRTADPTDPDYDIMQDSPANNFATINPLYPGASTSNANLTTANAKGKPTILGLPGQVHVGGSPQQWDGTEAGWTFTGNVDFGQRLTPDEISTANMPRVPIFNGRDYFQAITGLGNGGLPTPYGEQVIRVRLPAPTNGILEEIAITGQAIASPRWYGIEINGTVLIETGTELSGNDQVQSSTTAFSSPTYPTNWVTYPGDIGPLHNLFNGILTTPFQNSYLQSGTFWSRWRPTTPLTGVTSIAIYAAYAGEGTGAWVNQVNVSPLALLDQAKTTFPSGLWWIKNRTAVDQHQLVDSVNGNTNVLQSPTGTGSHAYVVPVGDAVAWCWNAADTTSGFSITSGTHGLGAAPAFVIDRACNVYHQSLTAGQGLKLSTNAAAAAQAWTVNATTVVGPGGGSYYSWTEIPGYSAFDKYTGNANANGVFVYLGFRPAFVLIKSTAVGNWEIYDTTRDTYNPSQHPLEANTTAAELTGATYDIDLLSNGFKLRTTNAAVNSTADYIYAAFAENPFHAPVTAR